jgi:hypothetical protein
MEEMLSWCSKGIGLSLVYHRIIINLRIQGVYSYLSIFDGHNIDQGQHMGEIPTVARHIFQACPVWIYTQSNAHINVNPVGTGGGRPGQYRGFDHKTHPLPGTFSNLSVPRFEFRPSCSQVDVIYAHEQWCVKFKSSVVLWLSTKSKVLFCKGFYSCFYVIV